MKEERFLYLKRKDQFYPRNTSLNLLGKKERDRDRDRVREKEREREREREREGERVMSIGEKAIKAINEESPIKSEMRLFNSQYEKKEGEIPLNSRKMGCLVSLVLFIDSIHFFDI